MIVLLAVWVHVIGCGDGIIEMDAFVALSEAAVVDGEIHLRLALQSLTNGGRIAFGANGQTVGEDQLPPYETWFDTTAFQDGKLELSASIRDANGSSEGAIARVSVIVDNYGPEVWLDTPRPEGCVSPGSSMPMIAQVADDVEIAGVEFRVATEPVAHFNGPPYEFLFEVPESYGSAEDGATIDITVAAENVRGRISDQSISLSVCKN
jgi:hypothetical protein